MSWGGHGPLLATPQLRPYLLHSSIFHRVFCNYWLGVSFQVFGFRSTLLQKQLQDTHLTNGLTGVSGFHRRLSFPPPAFAPPRVAHTLQRALCFLQRVGAMFVLPIFHLDRLQCFWASPANPAAERPPLGGAWTSRAVTDVSHSSSINRTSAVFAVFVFVCLFYWAYLLYSSPPVYPCFSVWVIVTQYTCEITFNGDPDFLASVPQIKGPASSEALPSRTFILILYFGLPKPSCVCIFNFLL
jgi:hypothetical protein